MQVVCTQLNSQAQSFWYYHELGCRLGNVWLCCAGGIFPHYSTRQLVAWFSVRPVAIPFHFICLLVTSAVGN